MTDWRGMSRADFDATAPAAPLFALEPANVPAPDDGCGTGDLIALLEGGDDG